MIYIMIKIKSLYSFDIFLKKENSFHFLGINIDIFNKDIFSSETFIWNSMFFFVLFCLFDDFC